MNRGKIRFFTSILYLLAAVPLFAQTAYLRTTIQSGTSSCIPWVDSGSKAGSPWTTTANYIEVFPDTQYQTVLGFGGTFQEVWWDAMKPLSAAGKDSVIRAFFDTSGCNFNWGRIPIGLCDFDDEAAPYSLDDSTGDYQMKYFSLHRDSTKRIPLIKMAQAYQPAMHFFGSPWSPPGWMKTGGSYTGSNMKSDSATLTAYALYLDKFVQGYKAAGINVDAVCCQNEPDQSKSYPSCLWSDTLERTFYSKYFVPQFRKDSLSARIILGVFCCGNYSDWVPFCMSDTVIADFMGFLSHSFETSGQSWGPLAVAAYPTIPFIETESSYKAGNSPDWSTGVNQFSDLATYMSTVRASEFTEWDCVNNQTSDAGGSWNSAQDVMVNINSTTGIVTYNPYFYAAKHFGHFVKVGAKAVKFNTTGISNLVSAAFTNPNGDVIFVTNNTSSAANPIVIKVGTEMFKATLPPNSFNTLRIVGATAVLPETQRNSSALPELTNLRISNSTLYFSIPASLDVQDMNIILTDLQGRRVWTEHRSGITFHGKQVFAIRSSQGGLRAGTYLLTVKFKNGASAIRTVEQKVEAVN
jgi:glucosylceramidase